VGELLSFLISKFRLIANVLFFFLGDTLASCEQDYEDGIDRVFETSAHIIQTPENHPKERAQQLLLWCEFWLIPS
jgi:hypothetical protein